MLVSVARSSVASARDDRPANSNTLPTPAPARIAGSASRCSTTSLAVSPAGSRPSSSMRRLSRHGDAHRAGDERVRHVGGADAEGDAAERAAVRRVRIGADDDLARQRVVLGHHRVRDAGDVAAVVGGGLGFGQRAVRAQADGARRTRAAPRHIAATFGTRPPRTCAGLSATYEVWSSKATMRRRIVQAPATRRRSHRAGARTCRCSTRG